jgi:2-oxoglutarate ferredoxin oxidoreductase subunit alpha
VPRRLMEGSEAIAEAMVATGCRFFAGYPMTPFTEILEHMAEILPTVDGVCMNAESELEAIGMAWGAAATGARAATGSTGQGLALMQESMSEMCTARIPLVVINMGRGQGDYFQATRGGGHGDYRTPVLAPSTVGEAVELVPLAFHLADAWRNPVLLYGDYYLGHTSQAVEIPPADPEAGPVKDWALDGSTGGTGTAKLLSSLGAAKQRDGLGYDLAEHLERAGVATTEMAAGIEPLCDVGFCDDAELVVVAFGTVGRFVRWVVKELRADGYRVGYVRPITLFPFPSDIVAAAASGSAAVAVYENNLGQMIDDVRLSVLGACPVSFIGGLSMDSSGFGVGPEIDAPKIRARILDELERVTGVTGVSA